MRLRAKGETTIVPSDRSVMLTNTGLKLTAPITTACRVVVSPRASGSVWMGRNGLAATSGRNAPAINVRPNAMAWSGRQCAFK